MGRIIKILGIMVIFLVFYITIFDVIVEQIITNKHNGVIENTTQQTNSMNVEIGFGDKVEVTILRQRWYGDIIETTNAENTIGRTRLFGLIKIVATINNFNLVWNHFLVFTTTILITLSIIYLGRENNISVKGGKE